MAPWIKNKGKNSQYNVLLQLNIYMITNYAYYAGNQVFCRA